MADVRMTFKLQPEIMEWIRKEAKKQKKPMASIVVGAMERFKAENEHQQQLIEAGLTPDEFNQPR